jgi:hypothetical protein
VAPVTTCGVHADWAAKRDWAVAEHARRRAAIDEPGGREDFRLAAIAGASWAAGLAALMLGDDVQAAALLRRAADEYATSWAAAPPGSWGRPIAMLRCRLLAGDAEGAGRDAESALGAGAADAPGPIAGYCTALALLVLGRDADALTVAERIAGEGLEPAAVAHALVALSSGERQALEVARGEVLRSFEERQGFLEDTPVADTVLVLDALAHARSIDVAPLSSPLLPG